MKKTFLTTIVAFCIATGSAFAYTGGDGTAETPYLISSKEDMEELATKSNEQAYAGVYFQLTTDLTDITTVIGRNRAFGGVFDGNGYTVNVNINITGDSYAGVFGSINGAIIKNLTVTGTVRNSYVNSSANYAGGICAYAAGSNTVINCINRSAITVSGSGSDRDRYAGGICGYVSVSSTDTFVLRNCRNTGNVSSTSIRWNSYAGGICGYLNNSNSANVITISGCSNTGNITSTTSSPSNNDAYAGGIIGRAHTRYIAIAQCYNTGSISATNSQDIYDAYAGGIAGYCVAEVSNCYNTGSVTARCTATSSSGSTNTPYAGGVAGLQANLLSNCYNTGNITATIASDGGPGVLLYAYAGGIAGVAYSGYMEGSTGKITNCFAANTTITCTNTRRPTIIRVGRVTGYLLGANNSSSGMYALSTIRANGSTRPSTSTTSKDGKDATVANFQDESWLTETLSWDFDKVWMMPEGGGYPVLQALSSMPPHLLSFKIKWTSAEINHNDKTAHIAELHTDQQDCMEVYYELHEQYLPRDYEVYLEGDNGVSELLGTDFDERWDTGWHKYVCFGDINGWKGKLHIVKKPTAPSPVKGLQRASIVDGLDVIVSYDVSVSGSTTSVVGVENIQALPVAYYSLTGIQLPKEPESGVYIVLYDNGKAEKKIKIQTINNQ